MTLVHAILALAIAGASFTTMTLATVALRQERRSARLRDRILEHVNHGS